jgi:Zn-dependent peptidase ImmA (M78 family)/DNA-binding XRE family transcriptional regulator
MRPGTPGFVGERLKAAREARGITTAAGLAEMVGVSRASISQYERGDQSPSPSILASLSDVLNVPPQHFLQSGVSSLEPVFFRSLSTATKTMRRRAERRYEWLREICRFLASYVQFPAVDFPEFDLPQDPNGISSEEIEHLATRTRRHWGLGDGPISNTAWLLENKGAVVVRADLDTDELDAFSQWPENENRPFIVLGTNKGGATRGRFNTMHEVAHMLLHRHVTSSSLNIPGVFKTMENQAHRFAGAFLLPAETFCGEVPFISLDALKALKLRWRVSISTMIHRLQDLNKINAADAKRLWIGLGRRRWRQCEPYDDSMEVEQPRFLRRCFELLIEKQLVNCAAIPLSVKLNARDIEELANLPNGLIHNANALEQVNQPEPVILRFPEIIDNA